MVKVDAKFCVNCCKEYLENENFNWSCNFHLYKYCLINNVWWCCGKTNPNAKGCKVTKHTFKEENIEGNDNNQLTL